MLPVFQEKINNPSHQTPSQTAGVGQNRERERRGLVDMDLRHSKHGDVKIFTDTEAIGSDRVAQANADCLTVSKLKVLEIKTHTWSFFDSPNHTFS